MRLRSSIFFYCLGLMQFKITLQTTLQLLLSSKFTLCIWRASAKMPAWRPEPEGIHRLLAAISFLRYHPFPFCRILLSCLKQCTKANFSSLDARIIDRRKHNCLQDGLSHKRPLQCISHVNRNMISMLLLWTGKAVRGNIKQSILFP